MANEMLDYDEIVARLTGGSKQKELQDARQRMAKKLGLPDPEVLREQFIERLQNSELAPLIPKETVQTPKEDEWAKYRGKYGHGKERRRKIPEKTPTSSALDDGFKGLGQGIIGVGNLPVDLADTAGNANTTFARFIDNSIVEGSLIKGFEKTSWESPDATSTILNKVIGYNPKSTIKAIEQSKSPQYHKDQKEIADAVSKANNFPTKLATTMWQTAQRPHSLASAGGQSLPYMTGGGVIGRGIKAWATNKGLSSLIPWSSAIGEGTITTASVASDMKQEGIPFNRANIENLAKLGLGTALVGKYLNGAGNIEGRIAGTSASFSNKGVNAVTDILRETGQEIIQEGTNNYYEQRIYHPNSPIDLNELAIASGTGGVLGGAFSGGMATADITLDATGKAIGGAWDLGKKGIQGVSNLKEKLTTPSIEAQLDTTQGNKHFNPAQAYTRATEIIANSDNKQEIKEAKKYQDQAIAIVNERLGKFDEAIENETDETKKQKLIQRRDSFYAKQYEPLVNAQKAINAVDSSNSVLDFAQRHATLSSLQQQLNGLTTLTDPAQRQQATQAIQQQLAGLLSTGQTSQSAVKIITPKEGKSVTLQLVDGTVVKRTGNRNWRNNNAGNIEYGQFAKDNGAIGSDGRFAIFPDKQTGDKAKEKLLFESKSYRNLTLSQAINRYAPPVENNTQNYQNAVLSVVGGQNKKMSEYTPQERQAIMTKMAQVEGFKEGQITVVSQGSISIPKTKPHNLPDSLSSKQAKEYMQSQGIPVFNSRGDKNEPFAGGETKGHTLGFAGLVYNAIGSSGINGFTAFNDGYHKGRKSNHAKGLAFDISVKDKSVEGMARLRQQIQTLARQNGYNVRVVAEHPTGAKQGKEGFKWYSHSTGSHIHVDVFGLIEPSAVSIEPQQAKEAIVTAQDDLEQLLQQWDNEDKTQELQEKIVTLENEIAGLKEHVNPTQEGLQAKIQEEMDKLKGEQGKNIAIRYAQVNAQDEQAVNKAKTEIDELQASGLLDENQADNLRKLLDIKVAIKGTNQDDVHHQIINGRRGANNLETNLGLNDYDQAFTMALAGNTPDSATINRYMSMLTRFRDSHTDKATAFEQAYNDAQNGDSIYLIPKRIDNRVVWERGDETAFNEAKAQNSSPIEIHRGSGSFIRRVVDEARLLSDFSNTWDNILSAGEPIQAVTPQDQTQTTEQTQTQTNEINVGKARAGNKIISLSAVNNGSVEAGVDGWLGNPFNVGGNHGWSVKDDNDKWTSYADLLVKTLKNNDKALSAFMDLQDKPLAQSDEQVVVSALLNELSKGNPKKILANYQGYDYDNKTFDFTPQKQRVVQGIPKDDTGFYVGRQNIGKTPNDLAKTIKNTDRIGQNGWLGNPYSTQSKTHKTKDYNETLDKYANTLRDFLVNNDTALEAFLSLQDKTLHKPSTMNAKTEADVVGQMLDAVEGKSVDEAKVILANITGFSNGQVQIQQATNSRNKNSLHKRKQDYADKDSVQQNNPTSQNESSQQTSQGEPQTTPSVAQVKASDVNQNTINQIDNQSKLTPKEEAKKILQGKPVSIVDERTSDVPKQGGFKAVANWATQLFSSWSNKAINPRLGEIILNERSVKDSLAHGKLNPFKNLAFLSVKDVIEKGAVIAHDTNQDRQDSYFISAPIRLIDGNGKAYENIATITVHKDMNTQSMYIHSITLKENLLKPRVSKASEKSDEQNGSMVLAEQGLADKPKTGYGVNNRQSKKHDGSITPKDVHNILHELVSDKSDTDPFAHLTDEALKQANEQVEQNRDSELERQAQDIDRLLAEINNESIDPDYYENYDIPVDSESSAPKKNSLKDKVKVAVNVKTELTGVKPLHQVIDDLGLTTDHLMITKAINKFYDLKISFDGTTGKDIVSADNLLKELIAYSTNEVLSQLKQNSDDKKLNELKDSISVIKDKLKTIDINPKLIREALDSDYNLVAMAVTNADFKNILMGIEHTQKVHKNLFSKLVYGLMSVFGIPNKTSVNNLYEKTLTTLGDLIQYQASNNQSLRAGNLSVLQNVDRSAELKKPILAKMAGRSKTSSKQVSHKAIKSHWLLLKI